MFFLCPPHLSGTCARPGGARGGATLVSAETTRSASERRAVLDEVEQGEGGKVSPQWSEAVQTAAAQMRENERGSDPETQESAFAAFCAIGAAAARTAERSHERERRRTPYRRCPECGCILPGDTHTRVERIRAEGDGGRGKTPQVRADTVVRHCRTGFLLANLRRCAHRGVLRHPPMSDL